MNVFDLLGPVMVGPSSSHTAGAAKIGRLARIILGEKPVRGDIYLHGSFAATYRGHGSDRALAGGLLGFAADDFRLRQALELAPLEGMELAFHKEDLGEVHPNTVRIEAAGASGNRVDLVASSIGGGDIRVVSLFGFPVQFDASVHTLIIHHQDRPGLVAAITEVLAEERINIAKMRVTRETPGSDAVMVIETDQACAPAGLEKMRRIPDLLAAVLVEPL